MTCRDAIAVLAEYLDETLAATDAEALEAHLRDCAECVAYLRTYRRTPGLVGAASRVEMPPEMRRRLREFLLVKLGEF